MALNPATSLTVLDYILSELDSVLLMLINPGFARDKNEIQVPYAARKVADLRKLIDSNACTSCIQVDGRVSHQSITELLRAGADNLVLGSGSLFDSSRTIQENKKLIDSSIRNVL